MYRTFIVVAPLIYHLLLNVWEELYTISMSIFVDDLYWSSYSRDKSISCLAPNPHLWSFHIGEEILITWTHIGWVWWMFQNRPLPVAQEVRDQQQQVWPLHFHEEWWRSIQPNVFVFSWVCGATVFKEPRSTKVVVTRCQCRGLVVSKALPYFSTFQIEYRS